MKYLDIAISAGKNGVTDVFLTDSIETFEQSTGFKVVGGKIHLHGVVFHFYEKTH